ncbi:type VI secretion system lipoprotein TssJ [Rubrivirga sp.]|uniref:type VI secretion system lipoprotein TssJ n=1 Tax=Rubrivirga sp. TaxID=1885344 RepID=UPI003C72C2DA
MTIRLSLLAAALVLSGCSFFSRSAPPPPPVAATSVEEEDPELPTGPIAFDLVGELEMNGGGNAARVYLYPLSSDATFLSTPVQAFWGDPEGLLADDLAGTVRDATVRPGSTSSMEELDLGGAPFLGIAADLRVPEGDAWRAILPATDVRGKAIQIRVLEGGITVRSR